MAKGHLNQRFGGMRTGPRFLVKGGSTLVDPGPFPTLTGRYMDFSADNADNIGASFSESFAPSAINTTTGVLSINETGFQPFSTFASTKGTPVEFVTTGVLPPEYADTSKQYFLANTGSGGVYVYAEVKAGDYVNIPGANVGDVLPVAQNYAYDVNRIIPSSQGTGTHTVRAKAEKLCHTLVNLVTAKPYTVTTNGQSTTDKHTFFEVFTDGSGGKYIRSQRLARDTALGGSGYTAHGKTFPQGPAGSKLAARQEIGLKRHVISTFVIQPEMTDDFLVAHSNVLSTGVNISTNVCTQSTGAGNPAMSLVTGEPTFVKALRTGTLPAPLDAGTTYYARISGVTFTLHPTAADATANTNAIDLTTQGSGTWQAFQPSVPGDIERMRFVIEQIEPGSAGGNVNTPRWNAVSSGDATLQPADWVISGGNQGNVGAAGRTTLSAGDAVAMRITIPPGTTGPIRQDTGQPLVSGIYYQSKVPSSTAFVRFHDTLAQAQAAVGVATSALSGANACIKWTAQPVGRIQIERVSRQFNVSYVGATGSTPVPAWSPQNNLKQVITTSVDYNPDVDANPRVKVYCNGVKVDDYLATDVAKGLTAAAANDGSPAFTLLNSAASHVAFEGKFYRIMAQASENLISESEIIGAGSIHAYLMAKYGIG